MFVIIFNNKIQFKHKVNPKVLKRNQNNQNAGHIEKLEWVNAPICCYCKEYVVLREISTTIWRSELRRSKIEARNSDQEFETVQKFSAPSFLRSWYWINNIIWIYTFQYPSNLFNNWANNIVNTIHDMFACVINSDW